MPSMMSIHLSNTISPFQVAFDRRVILDDFQEVNKGTGLPADRKSVFCETNACKDETEPCIILKGVHPRRNIDTGFTCKEKKRLKVGISNKSKMSYIGLFLVILFGHASCNTHKILKKCVRREVFVHS
jgi:hypothetical protein